MQALKVRVEDLSSGQSTHFAFTRSPVNLGRNALNELALAQGFVSYWHGILRFDEQGIRYVDLGSTNGTLINGQRVQKGSELPVQPETDLRIGSLRFHLALGPPDAEAPVRRNQTVFGMRVAGGQVQAPATLEQNTRLYDAAAPLQPPHSMPGAPSASGAVPSLKSGPTSAESAPSLQQLFGRYLAYRKAYGHLHEGVTQRLNSAGPQERTLEVARILARFPALSQEKPFQELLSTLGVSSPPRTGSTPAPSLLPSPATPPPSAFQGRGTPSPTPLSAGGERSVTGLLNAFATAYVEGAQVGTAAEAERFFGRLAELLETFSKAFVELQKGQDQFGEEMSIRTVSEETPLQRARSVREVMAYLLDWRAEGLTRIQELTRGFAEVMIHQVALLNGMRAGAGALLQRLSPGEIERGAAAQPPKALGLPLPPGLWPFRSLARWSLFVQRHQVLTEEEGEVASIVFGRDFARAYATIAGERAQTPDAGTDSAHKSGRRST